MWVTQHQCQVEFIHCPRDPSAPPLSTALFLPLLFLHLLPPPLPSFLFSCIFSRRHCRCCHLVCTFPFRVVFKALQVLWLDCPVLPLLPVDNSAFCIQLWKQLSAPVMNNTAYTSALETGIYAAQAGLELMDLSASASWLRIPNIWYGLKFSVHDCWCTWSEHI